MNAKHQRGELSLFWAAVFVGVVALGAVVALMSMRHERNLFRETWQRMMRPDAGQNLQHTAEKKAKSESAAIRKCLIGGKVVYSNVECNTGNPTSRPVELHETRGVEPPKMSPAPEPQASVPATLQDKVIEKAVQR